MPSEKAIVGVLLAAVVIGVLFAPFTDTISANTGDQTVTNESVTADVGTWQELKGYDIDSGSETVYWFNSSSSSYETVTSPGDYELRDAGGEIKFNSSGKVSDGDDVKVSYTYAATDSLTTTIANYLPVFAILLVLALFAGKIQDHV